MWIEPMVLVPSRSPDPGHTTPGAAGDDVLDLGLGDFEEVPDQLR
jgi:hypothetical protein